MEGIYVVKPISRYLKFINKEHFLAMHLKLVSWNSVSENFVHRVLKKMSLSSKTQKTFNIFFSKPRTCELNKTLNTIILMNGRANSSMKKL